MDFEDEEDELLFIADPVRGRFYECNIPEFKGVVVVCTNVLFSGPNFSTHMGIMYVSGKIKHPNHASGNAKRRHFEPIEYDCSIEECERLAARYHPRFKECICGKCEGKELLK